MGKKLYSDEELLNRLQKFASELGRPPSQSEMDDSGPHAAKTYGDRFGSWNKSLEAAGLQTGTNEPDGRPPTPEEDLLDDLKSVAETSGEAPSERIYRHHGEYAVKTHCNRFGGWNSALRAAKLEPNVEINLSDQTLITALQDFAEELGRPPTIAEMDQRGPYTGGPYKRAFVRKSSPVTTNPVSAATLAEKRTESDLDVICRFTIGYPDAGSTTIQTNLSTMQMSRVTY